MASSLKKTAGKKVQPVDAVLPLLPYQKAWFLDRSRFKIGMFARQTGKTMTTTGEIVDDINEGVVNGVRSDWVILSNGERLSKEAMEKWVQPHAKAYGQITELVESEFKGNQVTCKMLECRFDNGAKITALPATPETARGFSANVYWDEAAFNPYERKVWAAIFPVLSNGYKMRITSTPNGKGGIFYDLMTDTSSAWSRHTVDIYRAVAEGLPRDLALLRKALRDEAAWGQEFELKFLDDATNWLGLDLISACESVYAGVPDFYQKNPVFVGVDIGLRKDLFVIWVLEQIGDVLWTREIVTIEKGSLDALVLGLANVFGKYQVARCCIDQTGMGEFYVQLAKKKHGQLRVEGVLFTQPAKLVLATVIKQAFEDRKIRIPEGDDVLRSDLRKVKKETSLNNAPRFVASRDIDGHADRFWACALAVHASGAKRIALPDVLDLPNGMGSRWHAQPNDGGNDNDCEPISMWDE
jgi:phage FluMu gp28-like protein